MSRARAKEAAAMGRDGGGTAGKLVRFGVIAILAAALAAASAEASLPASSTEPLWMPNAPVRAAVLSGSTLYIGGDFTRVEPNTGSGVVVDPATGELSGSQARVQGSVFASAADGSGGWYIGGNFVSVGGQPRLNLAHVLADGTVDPAWDPEADSEVYALAVSGTTVYAGGWFSNIGGAVRNNLAALDANGNATSWDPSPASGPVRALAVLGANLYVGGDFSQIAGANRPRLAAFSTTTGALQTWNPNNGNYAGTIDAIAGSGTTVYVGGSFSKIGASTRNNIAAITTGGFVSSFNPNAGDAVYALAVAGSTLYAGGHFVFIGTQFRRHLAALSTSTGTPTSWDPGNAFLDDVHALAVFNGSILVGASGVSTVDPSTGTITRWDPNADAVVDALAVSGSKAYVGGEFASYGGVNRNHVAAIDTTTGAPTSWDPNADGAVDALALSGTSVYAGGDFTHVGATTRDHVAAIDAVTGAPTLWDPSADGSVGALAVSGSTVYAGGDFVTIGGQARSHVAALDAATGSATSWDPNADAAVNALLVSGSTLYAGGGFSTIGGQTRLGLAALDPVTGTARAFDAKLYGGIGLPPVVDALAISGSTLYAGGKLVAVADQDRHYLAALDAVTGAPTGFVADADRYVRALAVSGSTLYVGGDFLQIGGQNRSRLAALDAATGSVAAWDPNVPGSVLTLVSSGPALYAGGDFGGHLAEFGGGDASPPDLKLPGDQQVEATGPSGANDSFSATAYDAVDGAVAVSCDPASGAIFPLGKTNVHCSAADKAGNVAGGSFTVTVVDTTPPAIAAHDGVQAVTHDAGAASVRVSYTAPLATDLVDGAQPASCVPEPGAAFPLGTSVVTCAATDVAGNHATDTHFDVVVAFVDNTPPQLDLPENLTVAANSPSGATVSFTASASDDADPSPIVACTPPTGSSFAVGYTEVRCSATDRSGNSTPGSFGVTVLGASQQLTNLSGIVAGAGLDKGLAGDLQNRLARARQQVGKPADACRTLGDFAAKVFDEIGKDHTLLTTMTADQLVGAATVQQALGCLPPSSTLPAAEHDTVALIAAIDGMGLTGPYEPDLRTRASDLGQLIATGKLADARHAVTDLANKIGNDAGKAGKLTAAQAVVLGARVAQVGGDLG
jgi:hypothetical protein